MAALVALTASAAGCHLLAPPPNRVAASATLDGNRPVFTYWPSIAAERELRKKQYFLAGVQVREADCPGPGCDRLVWDMKSDAVWSRTQPSPALVKLPERIAYGESVSGMETVVAPQALRPNVRYSVVIGVMGLDEKYEDKIHFSANALFSLRQDAGTRVELVKEPQ